MPTHTHDFTAESEPQAAATHSKAGVTGAPTPKVPAPSEVTVDVAMNPAQSVADSGGAPPKTLVPFSHEVPGNRWRKQWSCSASETFQL